MGAEALAALEARLEAGEARSEGLWAENAAIVEAFLAVQSQWRCVAGPRGPLVLGLDYAGVRAGLALAGVAVTPEIMAGLRIVEAAAAAALNDPGG